MPSRAESRVWGEHTLRGIVIAVLAVMLWQSLRPRGDSGGETLRARGVAELVDWSSLSTPPERIHLQLDSVPKLGERAWVGALAGAGTRVTWRGDVSAVMIDAQPVASPTGGTRVLVAAPRRSSVVISDDAGPIDTVQTQLAGVTLAVGSAAGELMASADGSTASTFQRDSMSLHKILVIGSAGWESKFVVAALEEEGWMVDAFIRVAPGVDVTHGSEAAVDTSHYSAVIALDGTAAPYANRIIEFARTGGGVVLTPQSASIDALSALRAGVVGRGTTAARPIPGAGSVTLATLPFAPIMSLRSDAIPLERRAGSVTMAARRIGSGRVLQLGYEDTWRWRLGGTDEAIRDHRLWWTDRVGSVAYALRDARTTVSSSIDEAPMIGLVAGVGVQASGAVAIMSGASSGSIAWLFALLALGLLGEVASRRLRGTA